MGSTYFQEKSSTEGHLFFLLNLLKPHELSEKAHYISIVLEGGTR